jgi:GSH-dependent disulfide-bond oxidoreductase
MLKLYFHTGPNNFKVALFLEEAGLKYEVVPVDTRKGEQHNPDFLKINPNAKTPALVDGDVHVFDSNAILLYLAAKHQQFIPAHDDAAKAQIASWLMFIASGIGPYMGQHVHFKFFAPEPKEYATNRYDFEAWRHWNILESHLANHDFIAADEYSIVDMAAWGWARMIPFALGDDAWTKLPNLKKWFDRINARPAAARAEALKTKFEFKTQMDADALRNLFPANNRLQANS